MTPVLVTIGPLSIPSYGAMLLLAFLVGGVSLALELRRRALERAKGDRTSAAAELGLTPRRFEAKLKEHSLDE